MTDTYGILYGVGVGPGDPELITLKAVRVLSRVDMVFAAASTKNDASIALSIASAHVRHPEAVHRLGFPMTREPRELELAWEANANLVAEHLRGGRDAAFLTLGDPLLYSTFGYLMQTLERLHPQVRVQAIPGVTSFQAASARTSMVLAESGQNFQVVSGVCSEEKLVRVLGHADTTVILKAYRNLPMIRAVIERLGLLESSVLATRVGHPDEAVMPLADAPERPHYFSLVLVGNPHTVE